MGTIDAVVSGDTKANFGVELWGHWGGSGSTDGGIHLIPSAEVCCCVNVWHRLERGRQGSTDNNTRGDKCEHSSKSSGFLNQEASAGLTLLYL